MIRSFRRSTESELLSLTSTFYNPQFLIKPLQMLIISIHAADVVFVVLTTVMLQLL